MSSDFGASKALAGSLAASGSEARVREEIKLDQGLVNSTHWRHQFKQRLTVIQNSCRVNAQFDKLRGIVRLSCSRAAVDAARDLIDDMGGQRRQVKKPTWAELLRTQTVKKGTEATIAKLQRESGCRIHVERLSQEVRLVGKFEDIVVAEKLLEDLENSCIEEEVELEGKSMTWFAMKALEVSCGVTLQLEEDRLIFLGMQDSVAKAIKDLDRYLNSYLNDPEFHLEHLARENDIKENKSQRCPDSSKFSSCPHPCKNHTWGARILSCLGLELHGEQNSTLG
jgi:hypothetical protein